ncbi:MAG TPA: CcmD family protein [Thermoanaerobaculia bacterium]|nr:CcmD family protein [Thermoanaerobaculia bacterium]
MEEGGLGWVLLVNGIIWGGFGLYLLWLGRRTADLEKR